MRSYDETIARVFEKGDAILEIKRTRALYIKRISAAVSGVCAAAIVGFSVLHNNAAKNAVNHNINNESIIVTETVSGTQTTTMPLTENDIHTSVYHTEVSAKKTETAISTSLQKKDTTSAYTKETITTGVNAVKTASAHSIGQTETTTTVGGTIISPTDEGSIDMKKIAAFTTAFLAGLSAIPLTANANDNYKLYSFDNSNDKAIIASIADGKKDIDIDGNGKFDIYDVYQYYLYCNGYIVTDSVKQKSEALGDLDGFDDSFMFFDSDILTKYYIMSNPLDTSIFDINNYEAVPPTPEVQAEIDMYGGESDPSYTSAKYFATNLKFHMKYNGTGYGFMKEMYESGEISADVNGDGVFDIKDCTDYQIFIENLIYNDTELYERFKDTLIEGAVNWNQDDIFYISVSGPSYDEDYPCPYDIIELPESTIEGCAALFSKIGEYGGIYSGRYMAYCYLLDNPLDEAYFTKDYFEQYHEGASNYKINEAFIFAARTVDNIEYCSSFDKEKFKEDFKAYCKDVADGTKPAPDMNGDGKVDSADYNDAMTYLNRNFFPVIGETEEEFEENMPLPKKVWDNFAKNCDLNNDGKSGNIYDIVMLQCYTLLNDDEAFNESANKKFMISKKLQSNFALLDSLDIERSGDSNLDGDTDLADAVLIMQANANPDKYSITDKGKFNADVNETGDGVTTKDAQSIQRKLLALE